MLALVVGSSSMANSPVNLAVDTAMVSVNFAMCLVHFPLDSLFIYRAHCGWVCGG